MGYAPGPQLAPASWVDRALVGAAPTPAARAASGHPSGRGQGRRPLLQFACCRYHFQQQRRCQCMCKPLAWPLLLLPAFAAAAQHHPSRRRAAAVGRRACRPPASALSGLERVGPLAGSPGSRSCDTCAVCSSILSRPPDQLRDYNKADRASVPALAPTRGSNTECRSPGSLSCLA